MHPAAHPDPLPYQAAARQSDSRDHAAEGIRRRQLDVRRRARPDRAATFVDRHYGAPRPYVNEPVDQFIVAL